MSSPAVLPTVVRANCFEYAHELADGSVPLVVADPPYVDLLPEAWDRAGSLYDRLA